MPKFEIEKLVRDKIADGFLEDSRNSIDFEQLSGDEKISALIKKFDEEVKELSLSSKEDLKKELVDIQSLIKATIEELGIKPEEFNVMVEKREIESGGFKKGIYLKRVTFAEDYKWTSYFRKKYKEIK